MVSEADFRAIAELVLAAVPAQRIIVFGSHANGSATANSDVDLCVIVADDVDVRRAGAAIRRAFMRAALEIPVDLVVRTRSEFDRRRTQFAHLLWLVDQEGYDIHAA